MGIKGLTQLIGDNAPSGVREKTVKDYFGRMVAIDATMSIYQFLIAVRQHGEQLATESGEITSHLQGLLSRTIRLMENGLKPFYVFDGKPPTMKRAELDRREARREQTRTELKEAEEAGDAAATEKYQRRLVKVTREHMEECQRLLTLMGVPWMVAPTEAEAQCAALAHARLVFAAGSEDMDSLTFGAPILLRHLTFSEARKMPIKEFDTERVLAALELTMDQFIDVCILLGCDYCDSVRGIGPTKALQLIRKHGSIEKILENIDRAKFKVPEPFLYKEARELFVHPDVEVDPAKIPPIKWRDPDEEGLKAFLVAEKGFDESRVVRAVQRLRDTKSQSTQGRLESFFGAVSVVPSKRKAEKELAAARQRKMKGKGKGKGRAWGGK